MIICKYNPEILNFAVFPDRQLRVPGARYTPRPAAHKGADPSQPSELLDQEPKNEDTLIQIAFSPTHVLAAE